MDITKEIIREFSLSSEGVIGDEFIQNNDDLMSLTVEIDHLKYVPSYMLWCIRNKEGNGNLVCDYTIRAIAEHGRSTDPDNAYLNFKYLCNNKQKLVVSNFLSWCLENLEFCDDGQINKSIKRWQSAANK